MEFINNDPAATVRGANVKATLEALREAPAFSDRLIERHGLQRDALTAEVFVPVQRWLNALRDIQSQVGESALRETGIRLVQNAEFPPNYLTVESILLALNDIYYVNHRGDVGYYKAEQHPDGTVTIACATPYPRNFERGLIEGICRNRRAGGTIYCVEYEEAMPGGEFTCTLTVHRA